MAAFNYTGMARVTWGSGFNNSEHFIDFNAERKTLRVWPVSFEGRVNGYPPAAYAEYIGSIDDHPAEHIHFLHQS